MSKHTPGPWTNEDFMIMADDGSVITDVHSIDDFPCIEQDNNEAGLKQIAEECEANACLIAAAPDLLEACKVALESLRAFNEMSVPRQMRELIKRTYEHSPEIKGLVAAIQKAEGVE